MTDRDNGVYGICLRGKPGWGDNMAFLTTMANSFGARWFDEQWRPQLDSPAWNHAVSFYVNLLTNHGPPGSEANSFNEILALMNEGKVRNVDRRHHRGQLRHPTPVSRRSPTRSLSRSPLLP